MNPDSPMPAPGTIRVRANSEWFDTPAGTSLAAFLAARGLVVGRVVVELNGEALSPSEAREITLREGDKMQIVRISAGG